MLKNKCCLYVIISIRFFSITICNLLIEFPSYISKYDTIIRTSFLFLSNGTEFRSIRATFIFARRALSCWVTESYGRTNEGRRRFCNFGEVKNSCFQLQANRCVTRQCKVSPGQLEERAVAVQLLEICACRVEHVRFLLGDGRLLQRLSGM